MSGSLLIYMLLGVDIGTARDETSSFAGRPVELQGRVVL